MNNENRHEIYHMDLHNHHALALVMAATAT
jgi:hypothetical protein